jgi:hypothetical protein
MVDGDEFPRDPVLRARGRELARNELEPLGLLLPAFLSRIAPFLICSDRTIGVCAEPGSLLGFYEGGRKEQSD